MTLIGDVCGNLHEYFKIVKNTDYSVALGNVGMKSTYDTLIDYPLDVTRHQVVMGVEDFYPYVDYPISLGDYGFFDLENTVYGFVRGASSIQHKNPVLAKEWFTRKGCYWENDQDISFPQDEQLSDRELSDMADAVTYRKPTVMISHDCPYSIAGSMLNKYRKTTTRIGLEKIWEAHQPYIWVFAHHKKSKTFEANGTKFICLNQLETLTL